MAQVILPTTFIDNTALPLDDLNRSLYDKTPGQGLYSEPNGGIELQSTENGGADFTLRQEHMQPEQVVKTRFDGGWHTLDNMSDVSGQTTVDSNNVEVAAGQSLPGCGLRVYVPFEAAAVRWNISFFFYVAKWFGLSENANAQNALYSEGGSIQTFLFVDGVEKPEWRREYPMTWFKRAVANYATSSGGGTNSNEAPYSTEVSRRRLRTSVICRLMSVRGFMKRTWASMSSPPTRLVVESQSSCVRRSSSTTRRHAT